MNVMNTHDSKSKLIAFEKFTLNKYLSAAYYDNEKIFNFQK